MDATEDDLLLERAVRGDREALTQLLERAAPTVRLRIGAAIPNHRRSLLSVDDVMQEAYTDAFLSIGRLEPRGWAAFVAWLNAIALGNLRDALDGLDAAKRGGDWHRLEPKTGASESMRLDRLLAATTATPSGAVELEEARATLRRALANLPDPSRRVIEMYELEGKSIEEVAAALGRSEGAVYMLRARGIVLLRQMIDAAFASRRG